MFTKKRKALALLGASFLLTPQQAEAAALRYQFAASCAGLYGILEQISRERGDEENRRFYYDRFQVLGTIIEERELRTGGTKEGARDLVLGDAQVTMGALTINPSVLPILIKNCDDGYEELVRELAD